CARVGCQAQCLCARCLAISFSLLARMFMTGCADNHINSESENAREELPESSEDSSEDLNGPQRVQWRQTSFTITRRQRPTETGTTGGPSTNPQHLPHFDTATTRLRPSDR